MINRSGSLAVMFPGANYSCDSPLFHYARGLAGQANMDIICVRYGYWKAGRAYTSEDYEPELKEVLETLRNSGLERYNRVFFISKSLGTLFAGEAAKQFDPAGIRNLFLTPVPRAIPYIKDMPCSVVCGTRDHVFPREEIDKIADLPNVKLHLLPDVDHSLEIKTDYRASLRALERVCAVYEAFFSI